ncbi:Protein LOL2 [Diplonema papillatum]|nr:Protein LOL2 [Diplonema papillatum]
MSLTYQCGGCLAVMAYPQGSTLVSCSRCKTVSNVTQSIQALQIPCVSCHVVLSFPHNTTMASCPLCNARFRINTHTLTPPKPTPAPSEQPARGSQHSPNSSPHARKQEQPSPKQDPAGDRPQARPTTAKTRAAQPLLDEGPGELVEGQKSADDWSSVWQAQPLDADEEEHLLQEFASANATREKEWTKKKRH